VSFIRLFLFTIKLISEESRNYIKTDDCSSVERLGNGKYMVDGSMIHVRNVNGKLVVRIGGGWQNLGEYLRKRNMTGQSMIESGVTLKNVDKGTEEELILD
jgi:hypothetical protein